MHKIKILLTEYVTHDVKRFVVEKPPGYQFTPGQATDVAINLPDWKDKKHPFTFTGLNDDLVLEFIIKGYPTDLYPKHQGMTEKLHTLKPGHELIIDDPWGTINYQGPGVFLAGGAGITPFLAIFKQLYQNQKIEKNRLFFSNKEIKDVILEKELRFFFGEKLFLTLTRQKAENYYQGRLDRKFLQQHVDDFQQHFYLCGPPAMVRDLKSSLKQMGAKAESLVFEQ